MKSEHEFEVRSMVDYQPSSFTYHYFLPRLKESEKDWGISLLESANLINYKYR